LIDGLDKTEEHTADGFGVIQKLLVVVKIAEVFCQNEVLLHFF